MPSTRRSGPPSTPPAPAGSSSCRKAPEGQHVEEALRAVWTAHETLRLRFARTEQGGPESWAAAITPEKSPVPLQRIDLSSRSDEECWQTVEGMARQVGAELGQCAGSLVSFIFFDRGHASPGLAPGGLPPGPAGRVLVAHPRHGSGGGVRAVPDTRAGTPGAPERLGDTVGRGAHGRDPAPPARLPGPRCTGSRARRCRPPSGTW